MTLWSSVCNNLWLKMLCNKLMAKFSAKLIVLINIICLFSDSSKFKVKAFIPDSVESMKGRVIRALVIHVFKFHQNFISIAYFSFSKKFFFYFSILLQLLLQKKLTGIRPIVARPLNHSFQLRKFCKWGHKFFKSKLKKYILYIIEHYCWLNFITIKFF